MKELEGIQLVVWATDVRAGFVHFINNTLNLTNERYCANIGQFCQFFAISGMLIENEVDVHRFLSTRSTPANYQATTDTLQTVTTMID